MSATVVDARAGRRERAHWLPRQHGAWAMLAVPCVLGIAASRPSSWQAVLAVTAVSGYLASSAALDWTRARRSAYLAPAATFGALFLASGGLLLLAFPALAAVAAVVAVAAAATLGVTLAGHPRSLVASLAQAAEAIVLVPAAAVVAGPVAWPAVARATLVAGLYLVGAILVVRSMIRERGNRGFVVVSIGYHTGAVALAAWVLPGVYAALALGLLLRAAVLPLLQARLHGGPRRLRPIHLGLVEIAASAAIVLAAFLVRP